MKRRPPTFAGEKGSDPATLDLMDVALFLPSIEQGARALRRMQAMEERALRLTEAAILNADAKRLERLVYLVNKRRYA